ncbi:putative leucine-rich repeat receptor-like serine/threonine-protein kinase At2g24130 isoform X2 [Alnus glutinosa]|uniref:putative leucine-rich repeat receptor-like serine/threonine-protein kinase At2g24130 isoform X2 n=1 Tax=Alnus glutinosa TaxID=3517 RepID=UPI002D7899D7|nr:putative leucine-rich repeat receptor-like serine/threonine-protein kinase At2g24130 isoform X2 [Alnus glutinosa]
MIFIKSLFLLLLLQYLALTSGETNSGHHNPPHHSLISDKAALLAFKKTITLDPNSTLANWEEAVDVCNFTGVKCNKHHHRVQQLWLEHKELVGLLSPCISNLTGLRKLVLVGNHLFGNIPPEFSSLRRLRYLRLEENKLHGSIPDSFSLLSKLTQLYIQRNNISGTLPPSLFSNCTLLDNIDFSENMLTGKIPDEIGNCPALSIVHLYNNQFTGQLPFALTNASLYGLDVGYNLFSGELPSEIVRNLPTLDYLHLSYNHMKSHDGNTNLDPFFIALENCTSLEELELAGMGLGGRLPISVGRLSVWLSDLELQENQIFGSIPPNLGLQQLLLSDNLFHGSIPPALSKLPKLDRLDLSNNKFSGEIPESLGNLARLNSLFLNNNLLSGTIPPTLGQCTNLYRLDLSYNRLTGSIPPQFSGLHEIRIFINLSHNHLEGPLPIELSKLDKVQEIDVSSNKLTGTIFPQISSCIALMRINISDNSLDGNLPESIGKLRNLEALDVSGNNLSGMIPVSLNKIQTLAYLNLSFNDFEGMIPNGGIFDSLTRMSFLENRRLCRAVSGRVSGIPICRPKIRWLHKRVYLVIFVLGIFISVFLSTICCVIGFRRFRVIIHSRKTEPVRKPTIPELIHSFPRITHKELSDATGGFDEQSLIGSGSYGRVYRGVLPDGTAIAVKVLHVQSGNSTKSFNRECQVLKRIRHRNLIRIITACSLPDFKALVLPYMANGSLDSFLYTGSSDLSLIQRVNICSDIAQGMAYLHHHSPVRVIHCDLKPCNVLLNDDMTALVSDFGIAKLVMTAGGGNGGAVEVGNSTANMLCGSIGYIAPEYGFGSNPSTKGDVYSFGILVLEMVTRKRPTDDMFGGGLSLHKWVKSHFHGRVERVVDPSLVAALRDLSPLVKKMKEVAIGELIELGILCTQESSSTRPTMLDAADDLDRLKRYLTGDTTATFASSLGISSSTFDDD